MIPPFAHDSDDWPAQKPLTKEQLRMLLRRARELGRRFARERDRQIAEFYDHVCIGIREQETDTAPPDGTETRKDNRDLPNRYGGDGCHWVSEGAPISPACRHSVALTKHCSRCQELRAQGDEMPTVLRGAP